MKRAVIRKRTSYLTLLNLWRHAALTARKAAGKLHRNLTKIPDRPVVRTINGTVQFEHRCLPFLDEDDFRAMLTQSYDIILCDYLKRYLKLGDIVLDVGANVGCYISGSSRIVRQELPVRVLWL